MRCRKCETPLVPEVRTAADGGEQNMMVCPACLLDQRGITQGVGMDVWKSRAATWWGINGEV